MTINQSREYDRNAKELNDLLDKETLTRKEQNRKNQLFDYFEELQAIEDHKYWIASQPV